MLWTSQASLRTHTVHLRSNSLLFRHMQVSLSCQWKVCAQGRSQYQHAHLLCGFKSRLLPSTFCYHAFKCHQAFHPLHNCPNATQHTRTFCFALFQSQILVPAKTICKKSLPKIDCSFAKHKKLPPTQQFTSTSMGQKRFQFVHFLIKIGCISH